MIYRPLPAPSLFNPLSPIDLLIPLPSFCLQKCRVMIGTALRLGFIPARLKPLTPWLHFNQRLYTLRVA